MRVPRLLIIACATVVTVSLTRCAAASRPRQRRRRRAVDPKLEQYKKDVGLEVDGMREDIQRMNDQVFSFGELGFQEFETSKYLTDILEEERLHGRGRTSPAFRPRGWRRWGSGKPVIALGSDIDCIPQASQKPGVAYHEPIIEGAPGHGEGHNSGMPLQIAAALAVKKIMEQQRLPGTLKLWPGVAEELLGTKAYYVRAGAFKDVDVAHLRPRRLEHGRQLGRRRRQRAGVGRVHLQGRERALRRRAVARPLRARRRRADEHRLELPPRAPAHPAALALRHHQRRRPAERRPAERLGLVLLPRDRLPAHQGDVGDRRHDGEGRGDDDQHRVRPCACSARPGRSTSTRRSPRRCTRTSRRSACRSGPRPIRRSPRRCRRS